MRRGWSAPIVPGILLWLLLIDWVFQWHHWFWRSIDLPFSDLARFGLAGAVATAGMVIAPIIKRGWRYAGWLATIALAPIFVLAYVAVILVSSPVTVLPYPRKLAGSVLSACAWTSRTLVGKLVAWVVVVALALVLPMTFRPVTATVGGIALAVALGLFLAGFLHLASNPLVFVETWHRLLHWLRKPTTRIAKWQNYDKTLPASPDALETGWYKYLLYSTAYMNVKLDDLEQAKSLWRYLGAFLLGLTGAFLTSALAYGAVFAVLARHAALSDVPTTATVIDRLTLGLIIMTNLSVPPQFLSPPSWYTLVVFLAVATSFYLGAVAVLAFTVGARTNIDDMAKSLSAMWTQAINGNITEMDRVDPGGSHSANVQKAKAIVTRKLR